MPRVRIKRLPSNKRKVRIIKHPSNDYSLPNKVDYAGLQKFIFDGGGVAGGVNSPISKNNRPMVPAEFIKPVPTLPLKEIPIPGITDREEGTFTQDFKRKDMFNIDAESGINQFNTLGRKGANIIDTINTAKQERELNENMYAPEELYASATEDFRGGFNPNSGLLEEQKMGAKDLTLIQKGGTVPKYQDRGEVKPTGTYDGDEMIEVTVGYRAKVNPDDSEVSVADYGSEPVTKKMRRSEYDELVKLNKEYSDIQKELADYKFKREGETEAKSFTERGFMDKETNPGLKGELSIEEVREFMPEYYDKLTALESRVEELSGLPFADLRGNREKRTGVESKDVNTFGYRQANLNLDITPKFGECPKCPDGTIAKRDADNNCLPCAEATVDTKECQPCADGSAAVKQKNPQTGEEECVCQGDQPMAQPQAQAPFYLQDTLKQTNLLKDKFNLKKYLPWQAPVDYEEVSMPRVDPTAALAANAAIANTAGQAAASFAGPQGTARLTAIQGKAANQASNILDGYNRQNVGFQAAENEKNVNIRNKEAVANQQIKKNLYDGTTIANQQFDNSKRAIGNALTNQYANALTNKYKADALNQMYENFSFDPSVGGRFAFNQTNKKLDPTYEASVEELFLKYKNAGMPADEAAKTARSVAGGKTRGSFNDRGAGVNPNIIAQLYNVQQGGPIIFAEGGENPNPYGADKYKNIQLIYPDGSIKTQSMNEKMFKSGYIDYKQPIKKNFADGTSKTQYRYNPEGGFGLPRVNYRDTGSVQEGGPIYEHGGQHKMPFGTTNINQMLPPGYGSAYGEFNIPNQSKTTRTIGAVPREDANLEAEGGETVFGDINGDGFPEHNTIVGPRHAQGGVPLNLPDDTFIYSDYKTGGMKISNPDILKMFGKSGGKKKGSRKKPAYTPAELAKPYDINKYRSLLEDPNSDHITRRTAELMIENYNMKLGALALAQESSKGFPQGIPKVARPYMQANGINEEDLIPPPPQPVAEEGGQMMPPNAQMQEGGWYY